MRKVCCVCVLLINTAPALSRSLVRFAGQVFEELDSGGAFEESSLSPGHFFLSVHDAVLYALEEARVAEDCKAMVRAGALPGRFAVKQTT